MPSLERALVLEGVKHRDKKRIRVGRGVCLSKVEIADE